MNERIKLLALQAGCSIDGMGYGEGNVEKFAELIVKECVNQVDNLNNNSGDEWDRAMTSAANSIQEFFGVEE